MLRKRDKESLYLAKHDWLTSHFHFSFAEYHNPDNMHFGSLRVLNDDLILPQSGFEMHPHRDMEIISYILEGEITHHDSMGNAKTLTRGEVQYMSAGTGVLHSEFNRHNNQTLRLIQMWFLPNAKHLTPVYGEQHFTYKERHNQFLHIVSSYQGNAPIKIHQDVNLYVIELDKGLHVNFAIEPNKGVYLLQMEGKSCVNSLHVKDGDAIEITDEPSIAIDAHTNSHILLIEVSL